MPLLEEMLNVWEWLAILLTVAGAVLISFHRDLGERKTKLQKSFLLLLLTAFLFAISNIGFKYAMDAKTISFWNVFTVNGICCAVVALLFSLRKSTLQELKNLPQRTQKIGWVFGSQSIAALGITLSFIAIDSGPVSLVSTIMNIRPAFVFIFSIIISRFYPGFINERFTRSTVFVKLIGIAMITGGVAIISLSS
jgi:drug/metabolite transporter (DMT)-like permease